MGDLSFYLLKLVHWREVSINCILVAIHLLCQLPSDLASISSQKRFQILIIEISRLNRMGCFIELEIIAFKFGEPLLSRFGANSVFFIYCSNFTSRTYFYTTRIVHENQVVSVMHKCVKLAPHYLGLKSKKLNISRNYENWI